MQVAEVKALRKPVGGKLGPKREDPQLAALAAIAGGFRPIMPAMPYAACRRRC